MTEELPGKYLTAGLESDYLLGIVSSHPVISWTILIVAVLVCAWYGFRYFTKKKEVV